MLDIFQFIPVLQIEQYTKKPLLEALGRVQGVDEDLMDGQISLGQSVIAIPQAKLDPVFPIGAEGSGRGILRSQALEEYAVFVALNEQSFSRDQTLDLVCHERVNEALQLRPDDIVEAIEVGFALLGATDYAQMEKVLQIVIDGIAGDACLPGKGLQALWAAI